jgi:hypothetical protein
MTNHVASFHRSAALVVILTLFGAPVAGAQTIAAQPSLLATPAFARVVENKSIVVITTAGERHEGHFSIAGRALVLQDSSPAVTVPFEQVARVAKSTFRIRKHAWIGLGVGVGVGALLTAAACAEGCDGEPWFLIFGPIAGGIGTGVGAGNGAILNARNAERDIVFDTSLRSVSPALPPSSSRLGTAAFAQLVEGKDVWITTTDGVKRRGDVAVVTGNGLILTGSQHALLPFDQVVTIVEVSHRIRNGVVNGLAAGMSVGLLNCVASGRYEDSDCGASIWGLTGLGVGAGALVGVLMNRNKDRDLLYDAGRKTTMSFAPILSPSRQGVAFSMTWR